MSGKMNSDGGNAAKQITGSSFEMLPGKAVTVIPRDGLRKPEFFEAETIDEFAKKTKMTYDVDLRKTDGASAKEKVVIQSLGDVELNTLIQNSETLKGQIKQQEFLAKFMDEMNANPRFKAEMQSILSDPKRKEQLLSALKQMREMLGQNRPPVLDFLMNA